MIRRGLFHSTRALSQEGLYMFEIEAPKLKGDLVRFSDKYGREDKPYEGKSEHLARDDEHLWIEDDSNEKDIPKFCNCNLKLVKVRKDDKLAVSPSDNLMCFRGGIVSVDHDLVYQPGDVVSGSTYSQLIEHFSFVPDTLILVIGR